MKMKFTIVTISIWLSIILSLLTTSCTKNLELPAGQGTPDSVYLEARIKDAQSNFKSVTVEISSAQVNDTGETNALNGWKPIKLVTTGAIELAKLTIRDSILGLTRLFPGTLTQLRVVFANTMKLTTKGNPTVHNVTILKTTALFDINTPLVKGCDYVLLININASKSITLVGSTYQFNPAEAIVTLVPVTGSIVGIVSPILSDPNVFAVLNGKDTISATLINPNGNFLLRGLVPGAYTIIFEPLTGYKPTSKTATVKVGAATDIGTVNIN